MGELSRRTKSRLVDEASKDCLERLGEDQKRWAGTLDALVSVRGVVDDNHLGRLTTTILAGRAQPPGALV